MESALGISTSRNRPEELEDLLTKVSTVFLENEKNSQKLEGKFL